MKIDLHCHTKKVKNGDPASRNVSPQLFAEKVNLAGVDIVAVTNHNAFFIDQYWDLVSLEVCQVWPGVELDAIRNGSSKVFHIIVVSDPDIVEEFDAAVSLLVGDEKPDSVLLEIEDVIRAFIGMNTIFIPHYADKAKAINEEDKEYLASLVPHERLFLEPKDLRTLGICAFHGENMIIGSDVQDWSTYENCHFAELRLPVSSFNQLILLAKRDQNTVQHLLDSKQAETITVSPVDGEEFDLEFYNDVNIIFGEKGTGKSKILESIAGRMASQGRNVVYYEGSKRDEDLSRLLDKSDMSQAAAKLGIGNHKEDFTVISSWEEPSVTPIKDYLDWRRTDGYDDAKIRMRIVKMKSLGVPDETAFTKSSNDMRLANQAELSLEKIRLDDYLTQEEIDCLNTIISKLILSTYDKSLAELIKNEALNLSNKTVDKLKTLVAGSKGSKPVPSTTGFESYATERICLAEKVLSLNDGLKAPCHVERIHIGPLEDKGEVFIDSKWSMLHAGSSKDDYPRTYSNAKKLASAIKKAAENCLDEGYLHFVIALQEELGEIEATSLDYLVGTSRYIALESGDEYAPSNGEKGILLLRRALDKDSSIYLIDEPELGMGNTFIEDAIRPKISELGRLNKTVIIATHNANLAVRTLPYRSIYREHVEGDLYRTYVGNPFSDTLVDTQDDTCTKNWTETSLRTLEGGREAFGERGYIYDSADN